MARPFPTHSNQSQATAFQFSTKNCIFKWSIMAMSAIAISTTFACSTEITMKLNKSNSCLVPKILSTQFKQAPDTTLHGCLVMFWQSQKKSLSYQQPLNISSDGTITMLDKEGDKSGSLQLPVSSLKHPMLVRIYLFPPNKNKDILQDSAGHELLCRKMSAYQYNCFENTSECWLSFLLKPEIKSGGKTLTAYLPSVKEGETCRVCTPEVCKDNIDNDCDGKIDEKYSENGVPCIKKP